MLILVHKITTTLRHLCAHAPNKVGVELLFIFCSLLLFSMLPSNRQVSIYDVLEHGFPKLILRYKARRPHSPA